MRIHTTNAMEIHNVSYSHRQRCGVKRECFMTGETEDIDKFSKRLVRVTRQHNDECKQLLKLMGIPYVEVGLSYWSVQLYQ